MSHMISALKPHFPDLRVADINAGETSGWRRPFTIMAQSLRSWLAILDSDATYLAVKAGYGMWLTSAAALVARLSGSRVFLHHHSYAYVRKRQCRMVVLARVAGPGATHIVLSHAMANDLRHTMPEIRRTAVIDNAALVDRRLLDLQLKRDAQPLVLGHLSNLSLQKGIKEVVELALALHRAGHQVRLLVGGPATDHTAQVQLHRAARELGDSFEYLGALSGDAKLRFFEEISHFVFPTRYTHEAAPLVLYEAMAAGAVCVATTQGSIASQLENSDAVLTSDSTTFVSKTASALATRSVSAQASKQARAAFIRALARSQDQLAWLISELRAG